MLGGAQGARAHQRAEGLPGGEAGVLSKCERKRRTLPRPSLFCCARGGIFAFCRGGVLPCPWHFAAVPVMHFVGAGVLDGPFIFFRRESSAPSGAGHFWPQRPAAQALSVPPAAPFLSAAKEMGERTPPKTNGFWISFCPFATAVQKGSTTNRLYSYPRCRSHVSNRSVLLYQYKMAAPWAAPTLAAAGGKWAI